MLGKSPNDMTRADVQSVTLYLTVFDLIFFYDNLSEPCSSSAKNM